MSPVREAKARDFSLMSDEELRSVALAKWQTLQPVLMGVTLRQVAMLMQSELTGKRRRQLLIRLHQRFCRLRAEREVQGLVDIVEDLNEAEGSETLNNVVLEDDHRTAFIREVLK